MKELLLELTDYIISAKKLYDLDREVIKALREYDYEGAVKLRKKMRKFDNTIPTIETLEKLRNKLTTKNK